MNAFDSNSKMIQPARTVEQNFNRGACHPVEEMVRIKVGKSLLSSSASLFLPVVDAGKKGSW